MKSTIATLMIGILAIPALADQCSTKPDKAEEKEEAGIYELRTYTTNEGKLKNLHARFRDHTIRIFEKHGMKSLGYWVPTDEKKSKNTLIYILKHKSLEAAKASWKAFGRDPEWRKVAKESQVDGKILAKRPEKVFLKATGYSPNAFKGNPDNKEKICQLRIYHIKDDMSKKLHERFEKGTVKLFAKHGIESLCYLQPLDKEQEDKMLYYIIRFKDKAATKLAWKAFGSDPEWHKFRKPYGKPVAKAVNTFMTATDYSATVKKEEKKSE